MIGLLKKRAAKPDYTACIQNRVREVKVLTPERFAVRERTGAWWVHTHHCPDCKTHYAGFRAPSYDEAQTIANELNVIASTGVQPIRCETCR